MNSSIALFTELGRRLATFGQCAATQAVIAAACRENAWFTPQAIRAAVEAIRVEMLDEAKLRLWLSAYRVPVEQPKRVLLILAGNIPLVGFFDLLCVVAAGHRALVKPSSKERVMTGYLIDLLRDIDPALPIDYYDGSQQPEAVIATGSDNTNRYFRAQYGHIPTLLRGSRQSVAVLTGHESTEELHGLAEDIWLHNGLGCRNVSFVWLPAGAAFPTALRPHSLHPKYHNNYRQTKALLTMTGRPHIDLGGAIAIEQSTFPTALSTLAYSHYRSLDEVQEWLTAHDRELQCVVASGLDHPRRVSFGQAQHPTLTDYPDAVDVVAFLETI